MLNDAPAEKEAVPTPRQRAQRIPAKTAGSQCATENAVYACLSKLFKARLQLRLVGQEDERHLGESHTF